MKVVARSRSEQGSGASRRLRRTGFVPGIVYGGNVVPTSVAIEHNPLYHSLRVSAFHSSILDMELDGGMEQVLLRDVQWHAYKPQVVHIDFQRVAADEKITIKVPLQFVNAELSPAVKLSAAIISHILTEIEIVCLPGRLPAFIEVDLSNLATTDTVHVSDLKLPEGVSLASHTGEDSPIVTVTVPPAAEEDEATAVATPAADATRK